MADLIFYTNPHVARADRPLDARGGRRALRNRDPRLCHDHEGRALSVDQSDGQGPGDHAQGQGRDRSRGDLLLSRRRFPAGRTSRRRRPSAPITIAGSSSPRARSKPRSATRRRAGSRRRSGSGCSATAITTSPSARSKRRSPASEYIAADHFTAADLFVGANINFMLAFNLLEPRPASSITRGG